MCQDVLDVPAVDRSCWCCRGVYFHTVIFLLIRLIDIPHINRMNNEKRRLEATAIVMLGVIGSEFGKEVEPNKRTSKLEKLKKRVSVEGFSIANHSLAWHTSKFLCNIL